MYKIKNYITLIIQIVFLLSIFNPIYAKNINKKYDADSFSNYFSGILSLQDKNFENSYKYLKPLKGLEDEHLFYATLYQQSLVNLGRYDEAFSYAKNLEKRKIDDDKSNLIIGVYYLKDNNKKLAKKYFKKFKEKNENFFSTSLNNWLLFTETDMREALAANKNTSKKFNLKEGNQLEKIQEAFIHCHFNSTITEKVFENIDSKTNVDFSRYYFFYANYLFNKNDKIKSENIIDHSLNLYPEKIILSQFKKEINSKKKKEFSNQFSCQSLPNIVAETFYIISNVLSSQGAYNLSNLYLNLAIYLNPNFISYKALKAENLFDTKNYKKSKIIYDEMYKKDFAYGWHSSKRIAAILEIQEKKEESFKFLSDSFKKNKDHDIYEILDYANFLKNKKKYVDSIKHYSQILNQIKSSHVLFPSVSQGRGEAYERLGKWKEAEKDLLNSLNASPDQAYVLNYLAYTWIEKGIKLEQSLEMLRKANELKNNDGYIIDSLGWALFKLKKYKEAKDYLQLAVIKMPSDPIINDHFGDSLWMNNQIIQARYYWNYVLKLKKTDKKLKDSIRKKLTEGLDIS